MQEAATGPAPPGGGVLVSVGVLVGGRGVSVGAGGGGFLLLYCPRENQDRLRRAFDGYRELPFGLERDGSKVIFNALRYSTK